MGKKASQGDEDTPFADTVKESAQQIWLAGLGAFAKAQQEGGKVFQTLVEEGVEMQRKTQAAAEEKLAEASTRMEKMANEFSSKAGGQWEKFETMVEERVARAMKKMGVPSSKDIQALMEQIDELHRKIDRLGARSAPAKTTRPVPGAERPSAKAAKRSPARKAA